MIVLGEQYEVVASERADGQASFAIKQKLQTGLSVQA